MNIEDHANANDINCFKNSRKIVKRRYDKGGDGDADSSDREREMPSIIFNFLHIWQQWKNKMCS